MPKKFKLAQHQIYASQMMDETSILAIFYEAGTGKTMCVLDWLYRQFKNRLISNALIICPANLVTNWKSAIDKMSQFEGYTDYGIRCMHQMIEIRSFQRTYNTKIIKRRDRKGEIKDYKTIETRPDIQHPWGAIIIDESHGLGSNRSSQTQSALKLVNLTDHRYILTGTPVSGGGGQEDFKKLYGQLKFLDPDLWPSWTAFCRELVTSYDKFYKPKTYRNEECRDLMKAYGIVARLDDCYDMPDANDNIIDVDLAIPSVYNDIVDGAMRKYNIDIKSGGGKFIKLLELCSGFLKTEDEQTVPYECTKPSILEGILESTTDKVVIFCNYRYSIDVVAEVCKKHGSTVVFDGRSKTDTWRDFQYGHAKYLVCQYQSGGTGIDLFASHTMVIYESTLSSGLMEQAKARIHRKGQTHKCIYHWLSTKGTIEAKVMQTVQSGVELSRQMLDDWAKEKTFVHANKSYPDSEEPPLEPPPADSDTVTQEFIDELEEEEKEQS